MQIQHPCQVYSADHTRGNLPGTPYSHKAAPSLTVPEYTVPAALGGYVPFSSGALLGSHLGYVGVSCGWTDADAAEEDEGG